MKVLFVDSNAVLMHLLPSGFSDAGHRIKISGPIIDFSHLSGMIAEFAPDLVVTYGWGQEQTLEKQAMIHACVKERNIPHVYWSVEDPLYTQNIIIPIVHASRPDMIFTISAQTVDLYRSLGFRAAHLDWGFAPTVHYPAPSQSEIKVDLAVVANSYDYIKDQYTAEQRAVSISNLIVPLIENGIRVDFWGKGWEAWRTPGGAAIPSEWLHGPISMIDTNAVYNSARMVLGMQNYMEQVTQRTYEVLGAGGLLLTADTPAVRRLFVPGMHLAVSASPTETLRQVRFYLRHRRARRYVARQGHEAVQSHSYRKRVRMIIRKLKQEGIL